jgi:glutathione synthase/RimK-type ligase-like ATP-grasp enzyme
MKLGILTDYYEHYKLYEKSCIELNIEYVIIDFLSSLWLDNIKSNLDCDGYLVRPTHDFQEHNDVYMERLYFLNNDLKKPIYPSYNELRIYENKRNMASWLDIHNFPHSKTDVFLDKKEAKRYIESTSFPIVVKSNIGAGATGVQIVKTKNEAMKILHNVFGRVHPLLALGQAQSRKKFGIPIPTYGLAYKHVMLIQQFHKIKWEWRIIKIDNSYFGHQKLLKGEFASGSLLVGWVEPPKELLDLVRNICDTGNFYSMAVDIFETENGEYLVNELQSLFGSYNDSQMYINDVPGRLRYENGEYVFEEGKFNKFGSYLLRVEHFVKILTTRDYEK